MSFCRSQLSYRNRSSCKNPRRSFASKKLQAFPSFKILNQYQILSFSQNPINSFLTLPTLPNLKDLDISETEINSFEYVQPQPSLECLNIKNTPLLHYNEILLMSIIAFGPTLKKINSTLIPPSIYKKGLKMRKYLFCYLYNGWILLFSNPIKLFNLKTKQRLLFLSLENIPQIPIEEQNNENKPFKRSSLGNPSLLDKKNKENDIDVADKEFNKLSQSMPKIQTYKKINAQKTLDHISLNNDHKSPKLENDSLTNEKSPVKPVIRKKVPNSCKKMPIRNKENINIDQINIDDSLQKNKKVLIEKNINEKSSEFLSEEEDDKKEFELSPKQNLDHSNALQNLTSMKDLFKDLIFADSTTEVSETSGDYISDAELSRQLRKNKSAFSFRSDTFTTDEFFSSEI